MALIHCPECGHEISDTAKSCPNCGFVLSPSETVRDISHNNYYAPEGTSLPSYTRNIPRGVFLLVLLLFLIPTTVAGFALFVIPGILCLITDFAVIGFIGMSFSETRTCICPFCGGKIIDTKNSAGSSALKCPSCKKTSVIVGDMLKPIE